MAQIMRSEPRFRRLEGRSERSSSKYTRRRPAREASSASRLSSPSATTPTASLLTYDAAFAQPWERSDARRIINAITVAEEIEQGVEFAAVSNEGDVYLTRPGGLLTERIVGAGVDSPDASGLGSSHDITMVDGRLYVCGSTSQVYRRDGPGRWTRMTTAGLEPEPGFAKVDVRRMVGMSADRIHLLGSAVLSRRQLTPADIAEMGEAGKCGDTKRVLEIINSTKDAGVDYTDQGRAYIGGDAGWTGVPLPERHVLNDVFIETPDTAWMVGYGGTILRGSSAAGFAQVGFRGDTETILSFARYRDRYVAASDHALHWFSGHNLSLFRPLPAAGALSCLKVLAVDDVLYYFDYKRNVFRFDGQSWEEILIPPELLERSFKGLPRP